MGDHIGYLIAHGVPGTAGQDLGPYGLIAYGAGSYGLIAYGAGSYEIRDYQ